MNECKKGKGLRGGGGGGGFYPSCKKHGGIISTYTKMTRGDSFRGGGGGGGILSVSLLAQVFRNLLIGKMARLGLGDRKKQPEIGPRKTPVGTRTGRVICFFQIFVPNKR